jgi:hypothetical protein
MPEIRDRKIPKRTDALFFSSLPDPREWLLAEALRFDKPPC